MPSRGWRKHEFDKLRPLRLPHLLRLVPALLYHLHPPLYPQPLSRFPLLILPCCLLSLAIRLTQAPLPTFLALRPSPRASTRSRPSPAQAQVRSARTRSCSVLKMLMVSILQATAHQTRHRTTQHSLRTHTYRSLLSPYLSWRPSSPAARFLREERRLVRVASPAFGRPDIPTNPFEPRADATAPRYALLPPPVLPFRSIWLYQRLVYRSAISNKVINHFGIAVSIQYRGGWRDKREFGDVGSGYGDVAFGSWTLCSGLSFRSDPTRHAAVVQTPTRSLANHSALSFPLVSRPSYTRSEMICAGAG